MTKLKINKLNTNGFSLIELMVVIAILGFTIIGLVAFFGGGTRSWIAGQSQLKAQREARLAMDMMAKEIREAEKVEEGSDSMIKVSFPEIDGHKKDDTRFYLDANSREIRKNDGNILLSNLSDNGFKIEYFDSSGNELDPANYMLASKIELSIIVDADNDGNPDIDIKTDVNLRNYKGP